MDFNFTPEQLDLQKRWTKFAEEEIQPNLTQLEENIGFRVRLYQKMGTLGLFSLCIPKAMGGHFTDTISYALAMIALAKADAGITVAISVTNMIGEAIALYGTKEQQEKYLPKIASGEFIPAAFALTEKDAGSDAKSIKTTATRNENSYVLNGEKQFISNADLAKFLIVMAKTDTNSPHSISAFIVDQGTKGLTITKKEKKLGLLSANLVDFKLENCIIPENQLLGPLNGGFKLAMSGLDSGRISIAAQSVGIAEAAYEAAIQYAQQRKQFDQPIANFEVIKFKLADMHVKLNAAKLLLFKACFCKDQGKPFTLEASEAKLFASEMCNEVVSEALQIHGGYGYIKDYLVEKYFRDARVTTLYEGTSEIQRLVIAKHILEMSNPT